MERKIQKYLGDNTYNGDCWRTCLAIILNVDVDTFPEWTTKESWNDYFDRVYGIIDKLGYTYVWYPSNTILTNFDRIIYPCIITGKSPRSKEGNEFNHAVVWTGKDIIDPHPDKMNNLLWDKLQNSKELDKLEIK